MRDKVSVGQCRDVTLQELSLHDESQVACAINH
jgi:hypothetical protein